jgi:hypothetical protein
MRPPRLRWVLDGRPPATRDKGLARGRRTPNPVIDQSSNLLPATSPHAVATKPPRQTLKADQRSSLAITGKELLLPWQPCRGSYT